MDWCHYARIQAGAALLCYKFSERKVHTKNLHLKAATVLLADRRLMMGLLISVHVVIVQQKLIICICQNHGPGALGV